MTDAKTPFVGWPQRELHSKTHPGSAILVFTKHERGFQVWALDTKLLPADDIAMRAIQHDGTCLPKGLPSNKGRGGSRVLLLSLEVAHHLVQTARRSEVYTGVDWLGDHNTEKANAEVSCDAATCLRLFFP